MFYCPTRIIFAEAAMKKALPHLKTMRTKAIIVWVKRNPKLSNVMDDLHHSMDKL